MTPKRQTLPNYATMTQLEFPHSATCHTSVQRSAEPVPDRSTPINRQDAPGQPPNCFRLSGQRYKTAKRWLYAAACVTAASAAVAPLTNSAAWANEPVDQPNLDQPDSITAPVTQPTAIAAPIDYETLTVAPPEAIHLTGGALDRLEVAQTATPVESAERSSSEGPEEERSEDFEAEEFGARGSDRWYIHAGAATTFDNEFALAGAGISHFFANGHSINAELNGMAFSQDGDDAVGANLNLLLRHHIIRRENWSLYIDGGAGILGTTDNVPSGGSSFNFTPQAGGGATIRLNDEERLMVGLRWHHISNANTFDSNPGRDSLMGYVGLNLPR